MRSRGSSRSACTRSASEPSDPTRPDSGRPATRILPVHPTTQVFTRTSGSLGGTRVLVRVRDWSHVTFAAASASEHLPTRSPPPASTRPRESARHQQRAFDLRPPRFVERRDDGAELGAVHNADVIEVERALRRHALAHRERDLGAEPTDGACDRRDDDLFTRSMTSSRVRSSTGRRLSGGANVYHRISPRFIELFPALALPRERFVVRP